MFHREPHKKDYTVLDNGFLRDRSLSLKARGLMATILSLPDGWRFSVQGFAAILPDGRTAIESAVKELEGAGYIVRRPQGRGHDGCMLSVEWEIYEQSILAIAESPSPPADTDEQHVAKGGP